MKRIVMCTLVSALMAGCGGGGNGSNLEPVNEDTTPDTGTPEEGEDNGTVTPGDQVTVLEGTWKKQCGSVDGESHYDIVTVSFTLGTFTTSIENYIDSGCTIPLQEAPNPVSSGNFSLGEDVVLSEGLTATELDTHVTQFDGAYFEIYEYDIIYINNNVLYAGIESGSSPEQRASSLNYNRPFYRLN
ncbi:hypothetical protein [Marinobacter sp. F3R08]|uniref:hypothetical protein n=1 Tax=Marinobacter sp. F3R08 TaxID=2841559 RepID=UPI001C09F6C3|nr:hypothetical protein [Marinobacter sp. F3R08]MBU2953685.1 hypothetical protein [Marinobacter sp. F3R08]